MTHQDQPTVERNTDCADSQSNSEIERVDDAGDLIERDPLIMMFGDHTRARILMAMLDAYPYALNPTSIVEQAKVSRQSWYRHKDALLETGLIKEMSQAGNSPMYALVEADQDERVQWLQKLRDWTGAYMREGDVSTPDDAR